MRTLVCLLAPLMAAFLLTSCSEESEWEQELLARLGNADAQAKVGMRVLREEGMDSPRGRHWVRQAADQGDPKAQFLMYTILLNDETEIEFPEGLTADQKSLLILDRGEQYEESEAFHWLLRAGESGLPEAEYTLGEHYLGKLNAKRTARGSDRKADAKQMRRWYRRAAESGQVGAQHWMGYLHDSGSQGARKDPAEAFRWHKLAAEGGHSGSQRSLGFSYMEGEGVPQDYIEAHKWFNLAAAGGDRALSTDYREELEAKLSPEQLEEAQRRAAEWRRNNEWYQSAWGRLLRSAHEDSE